MYILAMTARRWYMAERQCTSPSVDGMHLRGCQFASTFSLPMHVPQAFLMLVDISVPDQFLPSGPH